MNGFGMTETTSTSEFLMTGAVVDERYELRQFVSQGSMGAVYKAQDRDLGRTVALKCILNVARQNAREYAIKEARTLASLSHPNIVQIYDVLTVGEQVWIVTEWLEGKTLEADDLPMSTTAVAAVMGQLYSALSAAHQVGIFHRDIKPSNLMLLNTGRLVLLDFGVAFAPGESSGQTMAGSLRYTDPRILEGAPPDAWSDLFSAALVQLELMTGEKVLPDLAPLPLYRHLNEHLGERIETMCDGLYPPLIETVLNLCKRPMIVGASDPATLAHTCAVKTLATLRSLSALSPEMYIKEWLTNRAKTESLANALLHEIAQAAAQNSALPTQERARWVAYCMQNGMGTKPSKKKRSTAAETIKSRYEAMYVRKIRRHLVVGTTLAALLLIAWSHIQSDAQLPIAKSPNVVPANSTANVLSPAAIADTPIYVSANAWADLSIDGVTVGRLPTAEPFLVMPGKRTLRLESPYVEPLETEIDAQKNRTNKFRFTLKPRVTLVELKLKSKGELFIDGKSQGTVQARELPMTMGKHEVWIKRKNRIVLRKDLTIGPDSSRQIRVE